MKQDFNLIRKTKSRMNNLCPKCKKEQKMKHRRVCKSCPDDTMIICRQCNYRYYADLKVCPDCGNYTPDGNMRN